MKDSPMRAILMTVATLGVLSVATAAHLLETAPHVLDPVFVDAKTEKEVTDNLINDATFKKAVKAAIEQKQKAEKAKRDNPRLIGSSPGHQAREAFLNVLTDKKDELKDK